MIASGVHMTPSSLRMRYRVHAGCGAARPPQQQPRELDPILPAGEQAGHQVLLDYLQHSMPQCCPYQPCRCITGRGCRSHLAHSFPHTSEAAAQVPLALPSSSNCALTPWRNSTELLVPGQTVCEGVPVLGVREAGRHPITWPHGQQTEQWCCANGDAQCGCTGYPTAAACAPAPLMQMLLLQVDGQ
jgi:hypothetical protein